MQRNAALHALVFTGHIGTAQATGDLDLDAEGAALHGAGDRLLDGPPVGYPALQLVAHGARHQGSVNLRHSDLVDVDPYLAAAGLLQGSPELIYPLTSAPDDDTGTRRVDADRHQVGVALDLHGRDASIGKELSDSAADDQVLP